MQVFGNWAYAAGTSGTVTLPEGATVLQIAAHSTAGGTVVIFGGATITITATFDFVRHPVEPSMMVARTGSADEIVFTGTTSYYVEYVYP